MAATNTPPPRLCRTPEEIWEAGTADAANDPPLTPRQIDRLAVLLRPYLRRPDAA